MKLGFITSNLGKLKELQNKLVPLGYDVIQLSIDYPEIQADTIDEVSKFGLQWVIKELRNPERTNFNNIPDEEFDLFFVEDSGLFVHSLNGFPGVYSKYVFKTLGYSGIIKLLLESTDRSAHFESCICAVKHPLKDEFNTNQPEEDPYVFKGICNGKIVTEPRGDKGFGYDPIFQANGTDKTFAEMEVDEKNLHSHRGKAVNDFIKFLEID
jgi:XTP/dITP diphosphohydrolase